MRLEKIARCITRTPLFLLVFGILTIAAVFFSLIQSAYPFTTALGNSAMVLGTAVLAVAWALYLRKDGVRPFSHRKRPEDKPSESWADRVPETGAAPAAPYPIPPSGINPDSPDYQRLAAAELALRKKIAGENVREVADGSDPASATGQDTVPGGGEARRTSSADGQEPSVERVKAGKTAKSLALAGVMLFAVGLVFQYLVI